jgi:1,4-dihydroxy-2-naphthoate octaprenyltransferase
MGSFLAVLKASRPKTWPAGLCPVALGTVLAARDGKLSWVLIVCSLLFSFFIQVATNFANDYFDFVNGADNPNRVGPPRAVASGWITPSDMRTWAFAMFAVAFAVSLPLVFAVGPWGWAFVFSAIAFGILYTGGPKPLGYMGLGEVLVLVYFGPVAVLGTYFVQRQTVDITVLALSLCPGLLSAAILTANNLRDEETDRSAKKNTLVVRWGQTFGRFEYTAFVLLAAVLPMAAGLYWQLGMLPFVMPLFRRTWSFRSAEEAMPLLPQTALFLLVFTGLMCWEVMR